MFAAWFLPPPPRIDHLVVEKSKHTLTLYAHGAAVRQYSVALGRVAGAKQVQGDYKTPEGHYTITGHNPNSAAYLSLRISYPNAADRARAAKLQKPAGGDVMIHGLPNGTPPIDRFARMTDWTFGCVALTNEQMKEVYDLVPNGTPIDIVP